MAVKSSILAYDNPSVLVDDLKKRGTDSARMLDYWDLVDTIIDGHSAMRAAGAKYLPRFPDEADADYKYRLENTQMTNVYRDIVEALASKPFEEEVTLAGENIPQAIVDFAENVDGSGQNLSGFAQSTFFNGVNAAIDWIFVDYPERDPSIRTQADAKRVGLRPFWSQVLGRNVLDVQSQVIAGNETLTYFKMLEPGSPERIREFTREPNGTVVWKLYRQPEKRVQTTIDQWELEKQGTITIGVIPMVPFWTGRRDGRRWYFHPVMRDAADLQKELYQQESDLKFTTKLSAYPMLAANGVTPQKDPQGNIIPIRIRPMIVLYAPTDRNGHVGSWTFIEPSATTLTFLQGRIDKTMQNLRELGKQPLTAQSGNLTTITTAVAAGKAKSAVQAMAFNLRNSLENALAMTCRWLEITDYSPEVDVFTEFDNFGENSADLTALGEARKNKDISRSTYWHELKRRRVLSSEFDPEEEEIALAEEFPDDEIIDDIDDETTPDPVVLPEPNPEPLPGGSNGNPSLLVG